MKKKVLFLGLTIITIFLISGCCGQYNFRGGDPPTGPLGATEEGYQYYDGVFKATMSLMCAQKGSDGKKEKNMPVTFEGYMALWYIGRECEDDWCFTCYAEFYSGYDKYNKNLTGYLGYGILSFEGFPSYSFNMYVEGEPLIPIVRGYTYSELCINGYIANTAVGNARPGKDNFLWQKLTQLKGNVLGWFSPGANAGSTSVKAFLESEGIALPKIGERSVGSLSKLTSSDITSLASRFMEWRSKARITSGNANGKDPDALTVESSNFSAYWVDKLPNETLP